MKICVFVPFQVRIQAYTEVDKPQNFGGGPWAPKIVLNGGFREFGDVARSSRRATETAVGPAREPETGAPHMPERRADRGGKARKAERD